VILNRGRLEQLKGEKESGTNTGNSPVVLKAFRKGGRGETLRWWGRLTQNRARGIQSI